MSTDAHHGRLVWNTRDKTDISGLFKRRWAININRLTALTIDSFLNPCSIQTRVTSCGLKTNFGKPTVLSTSSRVVVAALVTEQAATPVRRGGTALIIQSHTTNWQKYTKIALYYISNVCEREKIKNFKKKTVSWKSLIMIITSKWYSCPFAILAPGDFPRYLPLRTAPRRRRK